MGFADRENKRQTKGVAASMIATNQKTKRETKKRYNFMLLPSLYNDVKKIAYIERRSISDILSDLLSEYVKIHSEALHEYEQIKND